MGAPRGPKRRWTCCAGPFRFIPRFRNSSLPAEANANTNRFLRAAILRTGGNQSIPGILELMNVDQSA